MSFPYFLFTSPSRFGFTVQQNRFDVWLLLQGQLCLSFRLSQIPVYQHLSGHILQRAPLAKNFCLLVCVFLVQISFLLFLPQQKLVGAWVKGAGQGDGEAVARSCPAGAPAASPRGYSHEAAWGTTRPSATSLLQEENWLQCLSNSLSASSSATCGGCWRDCL